jgi:hypothetical protein
LVFFEDQASKKDDGACLMPSRDHGYRYPLQQSTINFNARRARSKDTRAKGNTRKRIISRTSFSITPKR